MKKKRNRSELKKGTIEERTAKCLERVKQVKMYRAHNMTWTAIGKKYSLSRQAIHKFYKENKYLLNI